MSTGALTAHLTLRDLAVVDTLWQDSAVALQRAVMPLTGQTYLLRRCLGEFPARSALDQLRIEQQMARELDCPGVLKPLALLQDGHGTALVLEDYAGLMLDKWLLLCRPSLSSMLTIAVQLADILVLVHEQGVVHRHLWPPAILVCSDPLDVKLTGWGYSAYLDRMDEDEFLFADMMQRGDDEAIAYLAPEQTGRNQQNVDARADLYSLGAILYRMLMGVSPFTGLSRAEMVHALLAQVPVAPHERTPDVPEVLSAVVMKLLAKSPDDGYQTAVGLAADLRHCLSYVDRGEPIQWFQLEQDGPKPPSDVQSRVDPAFLATAFRGLDEPVQQTLRLAACMGDDFRLETLAWLADLTLATVEQHIQQALSAGIVRYKDASGERVYRLRSVQLRQIVYESMDLALRQAIHLRLALRIMDAPNPSHERLLEGVHHANLGVHSTTDADLRLQIARWNRLAGRFVRMRSGHEDAQVYFGMAVSLLDEQSHQQAYDLAFHVRLDLGECEFLAGNDARAEELLERCLAQAHSTIDKARVDSTRVVLYTMKGDSQRAVEAGRRALAVLGVDLPSLDEVTDEDVGRALAQIDALMSTRSIESIVEAPVLTDPKHRMVLTILTNLQVPTLATSPKLRSLVILEHVKTSLQYGNNDNSPYGYMAYAVILGRNLGRYKEACAFGRAALSLNERFGKVDFTCKLHHLFASFLHFVEPIRTVVSYFEHAIEAGVKLGDFQYTAYACGQVVALFMAVADNMTELERQLARLDAIAQHTKEVTAPILISISKQLLKNLTGRTTSWRTLSDGEFDEDRVVERFRDPSMAVVESWYWTVKLWVATLWGDTEDALRIAEVARGKNVQSRGMYFATDLPFLSAMALLAKASGQNDRVREQDEPWLNDCLEQVARWAEACPPNYWHQDLLLKAEMARYRGDDLSAMSIYDQAIDAAQQNGMPRVEALAYERCSGFFLDLGMQRIAKLYMTEAYYCYLRLGVTAKADLLAGRYSELLPRGAGVGHRGQESAFASQRPPATFDALDATAVIRASAVLAESMVLEETIRRLLQIMVQSAGASRGVLLLVSDGGLVKRASMDVGSGEIASFHNEPLDRCDDVPRSMLRYVMDAHVPVVLRDARQGGNHGDDPYFAAVDVRSVLCTPLIHQGTLAGILYLENNLMTDVFLSERVELVHAISIQAAIAISNSVLFGELGEATSALRRSNEDLEAEVAARTRELRSAYKRLQSEFLERDKAERAQNELQAEVIRVQRDRLAELSAPLIPIASEVMVMPLLGVIDDERARQILEISLAGAHRHAVRFMILDVTGVRDPDERVAAALASTANALAFLGTRVIITGIQPKMAMTLMALDSDLGGLMTLSTLQSGIAYALRQVERAR